MTGSNGDSEIEVRDQLQAWADGNRTQADVIDYLNALNQDDTSLSGSQAENLRETADGWEEVVSAIDQQAPSS